MSHQDKDDLRTPVAELKEFLVAIEGRYTPLRSLLSPLQRQLQVALNQGRDRDRMGALL